VFYFHLLYMYFTNEMSICRTYNIADFRLMNLLLLHVYDLTVRFKNTETMKHRSIFILMPLFNCFADTYTKDIGLLLCSNNITS